MLHIFNCPKNLGIGTDSYGGSDGARGEISGGDQRVSLINHGLFEYQYRAAKTGSCPRAQYFSKKTLLPGRKFFFQISLIAP